MATTKATPMRHCREAPAHITKLAYLFPIHADETSSRKQPFVDEDFRGIMEVLREFGYMTWAVIPRTYAILRLIRRIEDMDDFLEQNLSDLSIPYTNDNLPINLSQSTKASFLKVQHLVLTSAMDLERGEAGEHKHIKSHEELQFDVVGELGRGGGCTQVQKVWSNIGRALYAVKFIRRGEYFQGDRNALRDFEGELQSAKKVLHHHVVKIVGSFTEEKYVGIIMETVGEMNLGQLLKRPINADTKSSLRTYFGCLASGLFAIHQVGIKHKDVKPENIVIRKSIAYFTDFGLALDFSTTEENRSTTMGKPAVKYTALYSAPEWWAWSERNTLSDIWSLGAVYLEMATVLYGETVHKLWDFLANHGTQNTVSYSRNLSGVLEWIDFLRSKPSHETDTVALDVVEATMKEAKEKRPKSYQLWKMIENQAPRHVSFACRACVESFHPTERPTQRPPGRGQVDSAPEFSRLEPVASRQELIYPEIHEFQHPISLPESIPHEAGLVRNDTVISRAPFPIAVFLENRWDGAVAEYDSDDLSFISDRTIRRHKLKLADGNILLTWMYDGRSHRTRFFPSEHLGTDFQLGLKCLDETFNVEDAHRVFRGRQQNKVGSAAPPTSSLTGGLKTTEKDKDVLIDPKLDLASNQTLTKAVGELTKTSTTDPPIHDKASGGIRKLEDRKRAATVSKNAEENNQNSKKEEVSAKATKKVLDKEKKIEDLKKFASSMKLPTAIPADLVSVLSNDKHKQKELIQKQNDIVNKTTGSKKAVVKDQSSQQRASPSKESPSALPPPKPNSAQPQQVKDSDSNDKPAVSQVYQPYVPQPYYGYSTYGGLSNYSTQQGEPSIISRITMQLEFHFSTDNLVKDFDLRKHMDSQGFVFLFFIASLDKIQALYASITLLRSICINSDVIEIVKGDDQIERVRRKYGWQPWVLEISSRFPHARHDGPEKHVPVMSALQTYGYHLPTSQYGIQPPYGYPYRSSPYGQLHYPPRSDLGSPPSSTPPEYRPIHIASYPRTLGSQRPLQTYNNLMYTSAYPPYQPLSGGTQAQSASTKEPSTVLSPSQPSKSLNERPPAFTIPPKKSAAIVVNLPKTSQIGQAEKPKVRFASEPPKAPPKAPSSTQQNPSASLGQSNPVTQANNASKNRPTPSTLIKQPQLNSPNQHLEPPNVLSQTGKNFNKLEADTKIKGGRNSNSTREASNSQNFGKFTTLALLDQSNTKGYSLPPRSLWSQVAALPTKESPLGKPIDLDLDLDTGRPWSHEEDALLCIAYGETTPTNWKTIAAMVGTRSQGQCKTRAKNLDRIMSPELRNELLKTIKEILQRKKNDAVSD